MYDYWQLGCAFTSEVVCIHVVNLYAVSMHLCVVCVCKGCMIMHIVSVEVFEMRGVCLMCICVHLYMVCVWYAYRACVCLWCGCMCVGNVQMMWVCGRGVCMWCVYVCGVSCWCVCFVYSVCMMSVCVYERQTDGERETGVCLQQWMAIYPSEVPELLKS